MTYDQWYSSLPYASLPNRPDFARYRSEEFQQQLQDLYGRMSTPDAAGRLPWGSNGLGVLPGNQAEDGPAPLDYGSFFGGRDPFTMNGQQYARVGEDLQQTYANMPQEIQQYLRGTGVPQSQWSVYDPEQGYGVPWGLYSGMGQVAEQLNNKNEGMLEKVLSHAPMILGGLGAGALLGGAAAGLDAAGSVIPAGQSGLFSQLGLGGLQGSLPSSYWNMLADAGQAVTDTPGVQIPGALGGVGAGAAGLGALGAGGAGAFEGAVAGGNTLGSLANFGSLSNLGALASGIGGVAQAIGSGVASNQAANAANRATDTQLGMFNTINQQQAPYRQAGYSALSSMLGGAGLGPASGGVASGQFTHQFGPQDLHTNLAPNYQFMLDQGLGAVRNQMNQKGGYAGNTLKAINDYAMNYADNSYQNAFNNYNANQTNIFNRLSNIAGLGQTANQTSANAGTSIANSAGNSMIAGGQAQAAGTVGIANALSNVGNNAMGWYALPSLLNAYSGGANL